jgi:hypothetical protein
LKRLEVGVCGEHKVIEGLLAVDAVHHASLLVLAHAPLKKVGLALRRSNAAAAAAAGKAL